MKPKNKLSLFFHNLWLLIRCVLTSLSFCALWCGLVLKDHEYAKWIVVVSVPLLILSVFANVLIPISKLNKKKR